MEFVPFIFIAIIDWKILGKIVDPYNKMTVFIVVYFAPNFLIHLFFLATF